VPVFGLNMLWRNTSCDWQVLWPSYLFTCGKMPSF